MNNFKKHSTSFPANKAWQKNAENTEESKSQLALGKQNYVLIGISFLLVVIGFVLMMGSGTTDTAYNPDIFSTRRIVVAPTISFIGFVCMLFAILRKPRQ